VIANNAHHGNGERKTASFSLRVYPEKQRG
jgi:hypothetical protein